MKKIFTTAFIYLTAFNCLAQTDKQVLDHEGIFSSSEINQLDSLLRDYSIQSGNLMLIVTDTADVSNAGYGDQLFQQYAANDQLALALLMSRKNALLFISVNKHLHPLLSQAQMIEMLNAGIPSLKEKRVGEGARLICLKAMDMINSAKKKGN